MTKVKYTTEQFVEQLRAVHGNKYDYSRVIYTHLNDKIIVGCPIHGWYKQIGKVHRSGHGCPKCSCELQHEAQKLSKDTFVNRARSVHRDKYSYDKVVYKSYHSKVIITCPEHGDFLQDPASHLHGQGCPICKESIGERTIRNFFEDNNISFISQFRFKDCKYKYTLPFDFYLPNYNMCIEFDGEQHFESVNLFGGVSNFEMVKKRDNIKNLFCKNNGIKLIRISYKDINNIYDILRRLLKEI